MKPALRKKNGIDNFERKIEKTGEPEQRPNNARTTPEQVPNKNHDQKKMMKNIQNTTFPEQRPNNARTSSEQKWTQQKFSDPNSENFNH